MKTENGRPFGVYGDPSWREVATYSYFLTEKIRKSGFDPDGFIGIQRGGVIPAAMLSYRLRKPVTSIEVVKDGEKRKVVERPELNLQALNSLKLVVVEDMLETGRSAQVVLGMFRQYGADVRLACFFANSKTEIEPDYVLHKNIDIPITFPWELKL